jgi:hypothetical protein
MKIEQNIDQAYISADYFPDSEVIPMLNILSEFSLNLQQVSTGKTWMDFGGWSPARLLHAGLNSGLMCKAGKT